ncbi:MAG: hypothetical protein NUV80_00470 [Candidatus Berkelbacteria bacterium]|nr:hypothetical protein [Candidatus Berkelbacteria bacterium]MCR4307020.1 hypothetical protein [Candidatus Berkelbacteria bacterium]
MGTVLVLLLLLSLVGLAVGLISPKLLSKLIRGHDLTRKQVGTYFGIAILVFFIAIGVTGSRKEASSGASQQPATDEPGLTTQASTPVPVPLPQTTADKLWVAYDAIKQNRDGIAIDYSEATKAVTLSKTSPTFYDEKSLVKGAVFVFVWYGSQVFKIDGVNELEVEFKTDFTDTYGNKKTDDAVVIFMSKEEFLKYNWKNLEYQPVLNQLRAGGSAYIHPAIQKSITEKDIHLQPEPK